MPASYNERLFVYITAKHRRILDRWTTFAMRENRQITRSEIVRLAIDQLNEKGYEKASPLLEERRGRPKVRRGGAPSR
jgi:hypothetical protein